MFINDTCALYKALIHLIAQLFGTGMRIYKIMAKVCSSV